MNKIHQLIALGLICLLGSSIACGDGELTVHNQNTSSDTEDSPCPNDETFEPEDEECVADEANSTSNNEQQSEVEHQPDPADNVHEPDNDESNSEYDNGTNDEPSDNADNSEQPESPEPIPCSTPDGVRVVDLDWIEGDRSTTQFDLRFDDVVSFKTEPQPGEYRGFSTYFIGSNPAARSVWVSECPGVVDDMADPEGDPDNKYCSTWSTHETSLSLDTGTETFNSLFRCQLESDRIYYINVKAAIWDDLETTTCHSDNSCYFTRTFRK